MRLRRIMPVAILVHPATARGTSTSRASTVRARIVRKVIVPKATVLKATVRFASGRNLIAPAKAATIVHVVTARVSIALAKIEFASNTDRQAHG